MTKLHFIKYRGIRIDVFCELAQSHAQQKKKFQIDMFTSSYFAVGMKLMIKALPNLTKNKIVFRFWIVQSI